MGTSKYSACLVRLITVSILSLMFAASAVASGPTETTLYFFSGNPDAANPGNGPVIFDPSGNMYGTTNDGGLGYGTVFELSPEPLTGCPTGSNTGTGWCETVLYSFKWGNDGNSPSSGLIRDYKGNLYGETLYGGIHNGGIVFELSPPTVAGNPWTETVLYNFCDNSCDFGAGPSGGLQLKGGNLYGTTQSGGSNGCCGIVFELKKSSGTWTESILYDFVANEFGTHDGKTPLAGVIFDKAGNLYGTTNAGGNCTVYPAGCGTVFELSPSGSVWTETILYNFQETGDGGAPYIGGLIFDRSGSLYGTTSQNNSDYGTVFKLSPTSGGSWTESVLHSFSENGIDGYDPAAGVIFYGNSLYGTTAFGGSNYCSYNSGFNAGCGTLFKLAPPKTGTGPWTETILYDFPPDQGAEPAANLTLHKGAFYSTMASGGSQYAVGAVFALVP